MQAAITILARQDPTSTLTLRRRMIQDINGRFARLKSAIRKKLIDEDFLEARKQDSGDVIPIGLAARKYVYERADWKVDQFMAWLRDMERQNILEVIRAPTVAGPQPWTNIYIRSSYQAGLAQARVDIRRELPWIPSFQQYPGGIAGIMNQPFHADRVVLIFTRVFNGMEGITEAMNSQLSYALAKGMSEGKGPYQIAIDMVGTKKRPGIVDNIGRNRARLIARTEIVQSHNEAALNEYERSEIEIGEEVLVQWWSALDSRVRDQHSTKHGGWHGQVMTKEEGRARLGAPNCRCSLIPWIPSVHNTMPEKITRAARTVIKREWKKAA